MPFSLDSLTHSVTRRPLYSWLETVAICVAAVVLGLVVSDTDPFFTQQGSFPWTLLAPMLVGLRYGFLQAFVAALLIIIANIALVYIFDEPQWQYSTAANLGMLLSAMVSGEFRDLWERRINRLTMSNEYRQARLEEFTRNYHVLKLSHDQLEQESAGQTRSMRSALMEVQQLSTGELSKASARAVLDLYKHYCLVQVAGLYRLNKAGSIQREPLASIGNIGYLDIDDPLVLACQAENAVVSVSSLQIDESMRSRYVALVPLIDSANTALGLLAVKTLPFMALDQRNLRMMAILAGRLADAVSIGDGRYATHDADTLEFFRQFDRVLHEAQYNQLDSSLLAVNLKQQTALSDITGAEKRGLDLLWETRNREGDICQLLLMPLSGKDGLARFRLRYEDRLREEYRLDLQAADISMSSLSINSETDARVLQQFLSELVQLPADVVALLQRGQH